MTGRIIDNSKTILVAPLNWGLGHATRCIPIIRELLALNCRVIIAGDGPVITLLKQEFPGLTFVPLKGYAIKYAADKKTFLFKIIRQVPGALFSVYRERTWLKKVIKEYKIDAVIADNRPGLNSKTIPSIYITHQLYIKTGGGKWMDKLAQRFHYFFINRFTECWVPDFKDPSISLAGELSHPAFSPMVPVRYIGALSRFEKKSGHPKQYELLILLSGPEPQRTILENILLEQLPLAADKILLVRGLPGQQDTIRSFTGITIINHLSSEPLNEAIQSAKLVIGRCGYTTVMDLIKLQQKAILVPTPGQGEQEYLATHLMQQRLFFTTQQEGLDLKEAIKSAMQFYSAPKIIEPAMNDFQQIVKNFIRSLFNN